MDVTCPIPPRILKNHVESSLYMCRNRNGGRCPPYEFYMRTIPADKERGRQITGPPCEPREPCEKHFFSGPIIPSTTRVQVSLLFDCDPNFEFDFDYPNAASKCQYQSNRTMIRPRNRIVDVSFFDMPLFHKILRNKKIVDAPSDIFLPGLEAVGPPRVLDRIRM